MSERIGVLFVCHANQCRSPLAEGIFRILVERRGCADRFEVDGAGTWAAQGVPPHPHSVEIAAHHGIDLPKLVGTSRSIVPEDLRRFQHIIAMDRANEDDIQRLRRISAFGRVEGRRGRVRLLRKIINPAARGVELDVPDPVGRGRVVYARVFELLEHGCGVLLDELLAPPQS
jgi:protein-tyrosine phosphatase